MRGVMNTAPQTDPKTRAAPEVAQQGALRRCSQPEEREQTEMADKAR